MRCALEVPQTGGWLMTLTLKDGRKNLNRLAAAGSGQQQRKGDWIILMSHKIRPLFVLPLLMISTRHKLGQPPNSCGQFFDLKQWIRIC